MSNLLNIIFKKYKDDLGGQITVRVLKENLEFYEFVNYFKKNGKTKTLELFKQIYPLINVSDATYNEEEVTSLDEYCNSSFNINELFCLILIGNTKTIKFNFDSF